MVINLISRNNGVGLTKDSQLLHAILRQLNHIVFKTEWNSSVKGKYDINFHIELVNPSWLKTAAVNILIPNPEWFEPAWNVTIKQFTEIWCKSHSAIMPFKALKGNPVYTGWLSADRKRDGIIKQEKCLHLKGKSPLKGTSAVIEAWVRNPQFPELIIVSANPIKINPVPKNITVIEGFQEEDTINRLMNECKYHICPSEAEGFGHYIAEAMSCGAIVITTDGPPMNELIQGGTGILVPHEKKHPVSLGTRYIVTPAGIAVAMKSALALNSAECEVIQTAARNKWENFTEESIKRIIGRVNFYS